MTRSRPPSQGGISVLLQSTYSKYISLTVDNSKLNTSKGKLLKRNQDADLAQSLQLHCIDYVQPYGY